MIHLFKNALILLFFCAIINPISAQVRPIPEMPVEDALHIWKHVQVISPVADPAKAKTFFNVYRDVFGIPHELEERVLSVYSQITWYPTRFEDAWNTTVMEVLIRHLEKVSPHLLKVSKELLAALDNNQQASDQITAAAEEDKRWTGFLFYQEALKAVAIYKENIPSLKTTAPPNITNLDEPVRSAWSDLIAQYQRRADILPTLVNTVEKNSETFERATLESVMGAHSRLIFPSFDEMTNESMRDFQSIHSDMESAIKRLLAIAENHPQLYGTLRDILAQLEGAENRARSAEKRYIEEVSKYTTYIRQGNLDLKQPPPLETRPAGREAPNVQYN